jgi:hypothetical protein
MAKATNGQAENTRSATITVGVENGAGNAVLAAWQGIYHLFGGRGNFEITPDGVIVNDFSVDGKYDPEQIAKDISHRNRRLDLVPTYLWVQGMEPEPFADAKEMTQFMVQYFRGSVEEGSSRSPKYVRDAVATFKASHNLAKKRGPRKKIFRVDNLSEIDENTLVGVNASELSKLRDAIEKALATAATNTSGESQEAPATV